jgi:hypothetical protein
VVEPADLRDLDDATESQRDDRSRVRSVLVKREVRPGSVIVGEVAREDAAQVRLAQNEHVARRTLLTDGKDDVRRFLHAEARVPVTTWRKRWIHAMVRAWPSWIRDAEPSGTLPVVREPSDVTVIVAGGDLEILPLAYCPS